MSFGRLSSYEKRERTLYLLLWFRIMVRILLSFHKMRTIRDGTRYVSPFFFLPLSSEDFYERCEMCGLGKLLLAIKGCCSMESGYLLA